MPTRDARFVLHIQRAVIHVQSSSGKEVTGANVLVAIFAERESHAAYFMKEQDMTHHDAVSYISYGIVKGSEDAVTNHRRRRSPIPPEAEEIGKLRQTFSHGRTKPVEVEKIKRRRRPRDGKAAKDAK
jgi:ATP-dependent Clp protease ATP-binding subunit ClpA